MSGLIDNVRLQVTAPKTPLAGLDFALTKLNAIDAALKSLNAQLAGAAQPVIFKKSIADMREMMAQADRFKKFAPFGGVKNTLKPAQLAGILGFDAKAVENFFTQAVLGGATKAQKQLAARIKELYSPNTGEFRSPLAAIKGMSLFTRNPAVAAQANSLSQLKTLFGSGAGGGGAAAPIGGTGKATMAAPLQLTIPASQIIATLGPGTIPLLVNPGQVGATPSSPGAAGAAGGRRGVAATAATAGAAASGTAGLLAQETQTTIGAPITKRKFIEGIGRTVDQVIKETDIVGETKTTNFVKRRAAAVKQRLDKIQADLETEIGKQLALPPKERSLANIAALGQQAAAQARGMLAGKSGTELRKLGLAPGIERAAGKLESLGGQAADQLQAEMFAGMKRTGQLRKDIAAAQIRQDRAAERALQAELSAQTKRNNELNRYFGTTEKARAATEKSRQAERALAQRQAEAATRRSATTAGAQYALNDFLAGGGRITRAESVPGQGATMIRATREIGGQAETMLIRFGKAGASVRVVSQELKHAQEEATGLGRVLNRLFGGEGRMVTRGLTGFTPVGFAKNLLTVGAWTAAVSALYSGVRLATYSLERMTEVGLQQARLGQVFRGVGGDARQLTEDILQMASANGQSTQDAMEAGVQWSRLGLTRKQVAEAVRVSLMGANVAEMSAAETTEHLAAVTAVYKLNVGELEGVLGMLNQTSNTARVRNADLLQGLSNVAAVGKEAGFSLAELQGIIGGSVEISGQTGSRMGNALKNILTRLGRPDVQDYLRNLPRGRGVEIGQPQGGEKSRAEILRELFVSYQSLNEAEKTNLAGRVAGANQANRFAAIMDSYLRGQQLAIDSQLNLNSAQSENAKILQTLKAQTAGLRAEWDRFSVATGFEKSLAEVARLGKNALRALNASGLAAGGAGGVTPFGPSGSFVARINAAVSYANPLTLMKQYNRAFADQLARWMETPFERGEGAFRNQVQAASLRASAQRGQARLYETVRAVMKGGTPEARRSAGEFILEHGRLSPSEQTAFAAGNAAQRGLVLEQAKARASRESLASDREALQLTDARLRLAKSELASAEKSGNADRIAEANKHLLELGEQRGMQQGKYQDDLDQELARTEQVKEQRQEILNLIQQQGDALQSLARLGEGFHLPTASAALGVQTSVLDAQIARLEAAQRADKRRPEALQFSTAQRTALEEQLRALRAQRGSTGSFEARVFAGAQDEMMRGRDRARREMIPFGFGEDQAAKLLRTAEALAQRIDQLEAKPNKTIEERSRLIEQQQQLYETINSIRDRGYEVEREINQLLVDRAKQFRESFFGAGPSEMLRKLAAFRTAFDDRGNLRRTSQGAFFAMSPGMRQDFSQLNPQFDPQRIELERERNRLNRAGRGVDFDQTLGNMAGKIGAQAAELVKHISGFAPALEAANIALDRFGTQTGRTADKIAILADQLEAANTRLAALGLGGNSAPPTGAGGQFGGQGGGIGFAPAKPLNKLGFD